MGKARLISLQSRDEIDHRSAEANAQLTLPSHGGEPCASLCLLHPIKNFVSAGEKPFARLGELDLTTGAVEQLSSNFLFEFPDLTAERRLRDEAKVAEDAKYEGKYAIVCERRIA